MRWEEISGESDNITRGVVRIVSEAFVVVERSNFPTVISIIGKLQGVGTYNNVYTIPWVCKWKAETSIELHRYL